jgi:hypothetical protein
VLRLIHQLCLIALAIAAVSIAAAQTPTISSISPNPGGIGQSVTIAGTNFGTSGSVTFNGVTASTTNWISTAIIATVPVGASTGNVVVTVNDLTGEICARWNERESTWRKSGSCQSRGTNQSRS